MKNLYTHFSELKRSDCKIIQVSFFKRNYEVRCGDELIGTGQEKGFFASSFHCEIFGGKWELYKPSIWRSTVAVRKAGFDLPISNYSEKFFKQTGIVELPKGDRVIIKRPFFKRDIEAFTDKGESIFTIKRKFSLKDHAEIQFDKNSHHLNEYPWLIFLGWLLIIQRQRSSAAT